MNHHIMALKKVAKKKIIITVWHFSGTNHDEQPDRIRNLSGNPVETINPVVKLVDWFSEANFANSHGYSSTPHGPIRSISKMIRLQFSLKTTIMSSIHGILWGNVRLSVLMVASPIANQDGHVHCMGYDPCSGFLKCYR